VPPPFTSFTDKSTTSHIVRMCGRQFGRGISSIEINVQRFGNEGNVSYSLFIMYSGPTFFIIEAGKSLVLIIDGQRIEIYRDRSEQYRNVISIGLWRRPPITMIWSRNYLIGLRVQKRSMSKFMFLPVLSPVLSRR